MSSIEATDPSRFKYIVCKQMVRAHHPKRDEDVDDESPFENSEAIVRDQIIKHWRPFIHISKLVFLNSVEYDKGYSSNGIEEWNASAKGESDPNYFQCFCPLQFNRECRSSVSVDISLNCCLFSIVWIFVIKASTIYHSENLFDSNSLNRKIYWMV